MPFTIYVIFIDGNGKQCAVITKNTILGRVSLNLSGNTDKQNYFKGFAEGVKEGIQMGSSSANVNIREIPLTSKEDITEEIKQLLMETKVYYEFMNEL